MLYRLIKKDHIYQKNPINLHDFLQKLQSPNLSDFLCLLSKIYNKIGFFG